MFDVNWEARSHAEIWSQLQGSGSGFSEAGGAWNQLASRLRQVAGSVEHATQGISATRSGVAADAARGAVGPMGAWADQARAFSDAVGSVSHEQSRALTSTRAAVPPPAPETARAPVTRGTWEQAGGLAAVDADQAERASLDAERQARAAMSRYQDASALRSSALPQFAAPAGGAPQVAVVPPGSGGAALPAGPGSGAARGDGAGRGRARGRDGAGRWPGRRRWRDRGRRGRPCSGRRRSGRRGRRVGRSGCDGGVERPGRLRSSGWRRRRNRPVRWRGGHGRRRCGRWRRGRCPGARWERWSRRGRGSGRRQRGWRERWRRSGWRRGRWRRAWRGRRRRNGCARSSAVPAARPERVGAGLVGPVPGGAGGECRDGGPAGRAPGRGGTAGSAAGGPAAERPAAPAAAGRLGRAPARDAPGRTESPRLGSPTRSQDRPAAAAPAVPARTGRPALEPGTRAPGRGAPILESALGGRAGTHPGRRRRRGRSPVRADGRLRRRRVRRPAPPARGLPARGRSRRHRGRAPPCRAAGDRRVTAPVPEAPARRLRLDRDAFLAAWRHLRLGDRPPLLEVPDHAATLSARDAADRAALAALHTRGLARTGPPGTPPVPIGDLADALTVLARPRDRRRPALLGGPVRDPASRPRRGLRPARGRRRTRRRPSGPGPRPRSRAPPTPAPTAPSSGSSPRACSRGSPTSPPCPGCP